jgi:hypothetical protein
MILWTHNQVGLPGKEGASIYAIVHQEWTQAIPASPPNHAARSTAPTRPQDIWGKSATCKGTRQLPPLDKAGKIYSGGHRSIPFSCVSSGFNNANPTQCYHVQIGSTCKKHDANMPPVFRLRSIAGRCH